jgi:hypothetical protein
MEESRVTDKLYHIMLFELTTLVVIGTDCTGSCKSNYHTITMDLVVGVTRSDIDSHDCP